MTEEEFLNNKALITWWRDVINDPRFQFIKEQAYRMRRFSENYVSPHAHLEQRAHGYKDGYKDCFDNLNLITDTQYWEDLIKSYDEELYPVYEQDPALADKISNRFS